jgi:hypothetical protein
VDSPQKPLSEQVVYCHPRTHISVRGHDGRQPVPSLSTPTAATLPTPQPLLGRVTSPDVSPLSPCCRWGTVSTPSRSSRACTRRTGCPSNPPGTCQAVAPSHLSLRGRGGACDRRRGVAVCRSDRDQGVTPDTQAASRQVIPGTRTETVVGVCLGSVVSSAACEAGPLRLTGTGACNPACGSSPSHGTRRSSRSTLRGQKQPDESPPPPPPRHRVPRSGTPHPPLRHIWTKPCVWPL